MRKQILAVLLALPVLTGIVSAAVVGEPRLARQIVITNEQTTAMALRYGPSLSRLPPDARKFLKLEFTKTPQGPVYLDLYLPAKADALLPLIIWIHGGGWHTSPKARMEFTPGRMVERGYALASIDYRDTKDAISPAQIQDCKAALRWLRAHAREYSLDPERVGVWGISAGGHLSALLGTSGGVKELEGEGGNPEFSSRPQAVCDFCGPTDLFEMAVPETSKTYPLALKLMEELVGGKLEENRPRAEAVNPIRYVDPTDPPFLIMHGDADPLLPLNQSELLYEALKAKGVEVTFGVIKGGNHVFWGADVDQQVDAFFDNHLKSLTRPRPRSAAP